MDRIATYVQGIDPCTGRPRLFAMNADKVTEMHRTGQAIGIVSFYKGELHSMFFDYRHVLGHTGSELAADLISALTDSLGLSPQQIRCQLTTAAFDGQYFCLNVPSWIAAHVLKLADSTDTLPSLSSPAVDKYVKWLICSWDGAHRGELVLSDVRDDKPGIDEELNSVEWYRHVLKIISCILASSSYGKGYEELLAIALGMERRLYALNKFQDTRFAASELRVRTQTQCITFQICC